MSSPLVVVKKVAKDCTEFEMKVYDACRKIPKGKVSTYASLAKAINAPKACRAVGTALKKNPFAPEVPCHRVVASDLTIGGFQGSKGDITLKRKVDLLRKEGVEIDLEDPTAIHKKVKIEERFVERNIKL